MTELALYFLLIKVGYAMVVMPEKYPLDQCTKITKDFDPGQAWCVVAPRYNCWIATTTDGTRLGSNKAVGSFCNSPTGKQ